MKKQIRLSAFIVLLQSAINISKEPPGNLTRHMRTRHIGINIYREKNDAERVERMGSEVQKNVWKFNQGLQHLIFHPFLISNRNNYIDNFVISTKPISIIKSKQYDDQLLRMIVKEYRPFSDNRKLIS